MFAEPPESLLILLDAKANESSKSKGKKEKRLQHATFREIYRSFEVTTRTLTHLPRSTFVHVVLDRYCPRIRREIRSRNVRNQFVDPPNVLQDIQHSTRCWYYRSHAGELTKHVEMRTPSSFRPKENGFLRSVFDLEELESVQMPTEKGNRSDRVPISNLASPSHRSLSLLYLAFRQ